MDLIYTNGLGIPQGLIKPSYFDEIYGLNTENTFELHIPKEYHCCEKNSLIFSQNSDIGGIIDEITVSTTDSEISYKGRTWAGILNSKIIEPPDNDDYYEVSGEANSVLSELIRFLNLDKLFIASKINSEIEINHYQFRYESAYDGIVKMLNEYGAKLLISKTKEGVLLYAAPVIDYSQDYEFNSNNDYSLTKSYNLVNHLICLGQGEMADRAVIHLFTNKNGGIMKYATKDIPLQDSDYILDKSQQRLYGIDEVTRVYDYSGAEISYNYIPLTSQPSKWDKNFKNYFIEEEDKDGYRLVEEETEDVYTALSSVPSNWNKKYSNYFYLSEDDYKSVEGIENKEYILLIDKPKKWSKKYGEYYEYISDGVEGDFKKISGVLKYKYLYQTEKPTDWDTDFSDYFYKNKKGKYVSVEAQGAPPFEQKKYYKKKSNGRYELLTVAPSDWNKNYQNYHIKKNDRYYSVEGAYAPKWKAKKYFTKQSYYVAPKFKAKYYYKLKVKTNAPKFESGKYYSKSANIIIPAFVPNKFFKQVEDRYAVLVREAIEHLKELREVQDINISVDNEISYEIGDIVGADFKMHNISAMQPIVSKRIYYNSDLKIFESSYNVGEFEL